MKRFLLFFSFALLCQTASWSQCPNIDTDGDGVLDCIDPCINVASSKIGNLSFESNFTGWSIPQNQSFFSLNEDANNILHGSKSLYVTAPNASTFENHVIFSEEFILEEGVAYNFKIPVKRIGNVDGDALRWVLVDENGVYRHFNNHYNFTSNWSYLTFNNFYVNFNTHTSNKFRLRLEFGLSTVDMVIDKIEFYETAQQADPAYVDMDADGNPDCLTYENHPDYDALVALYNALNGNSWYNDSNWLDTTKPLSTWYGITETNGRVTSVNLRQNNIDGTIPDLISNLSNLTFLDLAENNLTGAIPSTLGNIQTLEWLDLALNNLSGNVPNELTTLPNLTRLALGANNLSGNIPDFTQQSLFVLTFDNNNFQFGDFEDEFTLYQNNIAQFYYAPQKNPEANYIVEQTLNVGDNITLNSAPVSGLNTYYQWFFGSEAISGANSTSLELENVQLNEMGVYSCYAFNTLVTGLTMRTGITTLNRLPALHPEYDALVAFYNATDGDNWTNNTNWLSDEPINTWYGLGTLLGDGNSRVTSIYLNNNNLTGEIPNEIGNFSNLFNLELGINNLTGSIPQSITNLTQLGGLVLWANNLAGLVPDISSNINLDYVYISENNFRFADLEPSFTNYQDKLGVGYVYFPQKPINSTVSEVSVKFISIGDSIDFSSEIVSGANTMYQWYFNGAPIDINSYPNITDPTQPNLRISNITASQLGVYDCVAYNTLVFNLSFGLGTYLVTIPPNENPDYNALVAIYNSTNGDNWTDNSNWLDNTKPLQLWHGITLDSSNRVTNLNLGNNNLTGSIPPEIGDLTELTYLGFFTNQLTGNIPPEIGNLIKLTHMDLSPNTFSGPIPPEIGNLVNLETLWLNQNGLTGTIPTSFQNLTKLKRLYLQGSVGSSSEYNSSAFSGDFPDLTALPLELLWMQDNFFKFTDIADEFATYQANIPDFRFNPQFTTDPPVETTAAIGDDITLTLTEIPTVAKGMTKKTALTANNYQWFKDGVALTENANSDTYLIVNAQVTDSGVYHCEIKNADVPDMIIKRQPITLNIGSLSVDENEINTIKIYPNPVSNTLNIKLNHTDAEQATLFDMAGKQVLKLKLPSEITVVDVSNLNSGMYLLKIKTTDKTIIKRIIKN
ncbi:T9SS type A sorting domain-containing protein [Gelatiniphilus marinus]|uniref:T9SS type A sorting domain-containing protein n=1 Tax=Gelatiniphilus marinus TaxID=1759464 RepID=A0ABW5JRF5_9FLAO